MTIAATVDTRRPRGWGRFRPGVLLLEIWLPIVILVAWWVGSELAPANVFFPPLSRILQRVGELWIVGDHIATDLVPTLLRLSIGFGIALVLGVGFGILLGLSRRTESAVRPVLDFVRAVPGIALLPIVMMFFGIDEEMKIVMVALIATWPILLNTIDGIRSVEPMLLLVARSFRITASDRLRHIYVPAALPQILAGARIALSIAVIVVVTVEMFGANGGIGYFIQASKNQFRLLDMWSGLIVLGIFGYAVNIAFRALEHRLLRWHRGMTAHMQGRE